MPCQVEQRLTYAPSISTMGVGTGGLANIVAQLVPKIGFSKGLGGSVVVDPFSSTATVGTINPP